jgi:hypothetical protein
MARNREILGSRAISVQVSDCAARVARPEPEVPVIEHDALAASRSP